MITVFERRMMEKSPYKAIELWGKSLGSYGYYIVDQQELAARENAPLDALYRKQDHEVSGSNVVGTRWVCVSDLAEDHEIRQLYADALQRNTQS